MVELTFLKVDPDTGNIIYRGTDKNNYVDVEGTIHDMTEEGEPDSPVHNVKVKAGEPLYDKNDRFGRKLETYVKEYNSLQKEFGETGFTSLNAFIESRDPAKGNYSMDAIKQRLKSNREARLNAPKNTRTDINSNEQHTMKNLKSFEALTEAQKFTRTSAGMVPVGKKIEFKTDAKIAKSEWDAMLVKINAMPSAKRAELIKKLHGLGLM
jgi:hypothetical protein